MADGCDTLIIQRVVPHYRVPLFSCLHERFGIKVVTAATPPGGTFLNLADPRELDFAIAAPFVFPDPTNPFAARVPTAWIIEALRPRRVIAEFGMRLSSTYQLAFARRTGRLGRLGFWSHGWQMGRGRGSRVDRAIQFARPPLMAAADVNATYTDEGAEWIRRHLPRTPVVALGNALDLAAINLAASTSTAIRHGSPQFLAVGRLTADKCYDRLLDVFAQVRTTYPDAALTVIGDGPERERLMAQAGAQPGGSIRILGTLYGEADLAPHFMGADFCLIPGAAGLTVNHALAYCVPVVAFARSGSGPLHHPEIEYVVDGKTGVLVPGHTAQDMSEVVIAAYASGLHRRLRSKMALSGHLPSLESVADKCSTLLKLMPIDGICSK